jgi:hypothetical protein
MSMEIRAITATAQCAVSGGEGHMSAEIDSRAWGYNGGRSQYFAGDNCTVLLYISKNVSIVGTAIAGAGGSTTFGGFSTGDIGYNVVREGVTFNTPVTQVSKPFDATPTQLGSGEFHQCGEPKWVTGTNIVRLAKWEPTLDPKAIPPHGYMFVEYTPRAMHGVIQSLSIPSGVQVFSYPNTLLVYGIATPITAL